MTLAVASGRIADVPTAAPASDPISPTAAAPPTVPARPLRHLLATRYVTALREGGSVPAVVEADDGALYVAKFRAAAQGGARSPPS